MNIDIQNRVNLANSIIDIIKRNIKYLTVEIPDPKKCRCENKTIMAPVNSDIETMIRLIAQYDSYSQ